MQVVSFTVECLTIVSKLREGCWLTEALNFFNLAVYGVAGNNNLIGIDIDAALGGRSRARLAP